MSEVSAGVSSDLELDGRTFSLRPMTGDDGPALLDFARRLPPHDLLFLRRDITNEKVVTAWVAAVGEGTIDTVLAHSGDEIVGCVALIRDPLSWSPQLGEVRILVAPEARKTGLGRVLIEGVLRLALEQGLEKLMAQMTVDQKGAIAIFEEFGFSGEALLRNHVKDSSGEAHDIVILACEPQEVSSMLSAYR